MKSNKLLAVIFVSYGLLFAALFQTVFPFMVSRWESDDFNYAYLIPLIILYILWEQRKEFSATPTSPTWWGLVPLFFGGFLYWIGELSGEYYSLYLSSFFLMIGILLLHLGWRKIRVIWFALFLVLTMFPPPHFIYNKISVFLKLVSSKIGVAIIQLAGLPAYREGNVIDLGFTQLQVVDACSGLRYLIPLIVLGLILAYFFNTVLWKRLIVVISTVPLSIFLNSVRIGLTGILSKFFGSEVAQGFFHDFSGWIIFIVSLAILLAEMWLLSLLPGKGRPTPASRAGLLAGVPQKLAPVQYIPPFIVIAFVLGGSLVIHHQVDFRQKVPITQPFSKFPSMIGEWSGSKRAMEDQIIGTLDLSDYLMIDYRRKNSPPVNFYVAYYESQQKGESIHSPATCLPGSGWLFVDSGTRTFAVPSTNESVTVNRAFMDKGGNRQLVYYWFSKQGRILQTAIQLKLYVFWDALTAQRTDGALVRLITPVMDGETVDDADKRLQSFINDAKPVLDTFIPQEDIPVRTSS